MSLSACPLYATDARVLDVLAAMSHFKLSIVVIPATATIADAWRLLAQYKVLSAPLERESGGYHGLIDMMDLVSFLIGQCVDPQHKGEEEKFSSHVSWRGWCCDRDHSGLNPLYTVSTNAHAPELLSILKRGIHRVMVVDENGQFKGIISQFDILGLLEPYMNTGAHELASKTLEELGLSAPPPVQLFTINTMARTIYALHKMLENKVSAVAVVDDNGVIMGNMSASDLRGLAASDLGSLLMPVGRFLQEKSHQAAPAMCSNQTSLSMVTKRLVENRLHRLWCTDAMKRPIAVVSLTDVLSVIDSHVMQCHERKIVATEAVA